jgi:DNA ligase-1
MESEIKSKLTEGYFETEDEARNEVVILPMLAKSYEDEKHKIDWVKDKTYIQPKLDGMRCLAFIKNNKVTLMSRDGKIIDTVLHINLSLSFIMEDCILDGELYSLELGSFQENMKAIKKYRAKITEKIQYNVYDCITEGNFTTRFNKAQKLIEGIQSTQIVSTMSILNESEIIKYHSFYLQLGYEGSIIRYGEAEYKLNGRSSNLLKYKDFKDMDCKIIDITPNESNPLHGTPHFNLKGKAFKAGVKMSHEDREDLLTNKDKYIGKIANIRYFELTDDGIPRFPVMIGIHEDR